MHHIILNFTFVDGTQAVSTSVDPLGIESIVGVQQNMYVNSHVNDDDCPTFNTAGQPCFADPKTLEQLSFQATMDAFGRLLVGTVQQAIVLSSTHTGQAPEQDSISINFSVRSTVLMQTEELAFRSSSATWQQYFSSGDPSAGLYANLSGQILRPLKHTLEELFQNITISMMSSA